MLEVWSILCHVCLSFRKCLNSQVPVCTILHSGMQAFCQWWRFKASALMKEISWQPVSKQGQTDKNQSVPLTHLFFFQRSKQPSCNPRAANSWKEFKANSKQPQTLAALSRRIWKPKAPFIQSCTLKWPVNCEAPVLYCVFVNWFANFASLDVTLDYRTWRWNASTVLPSSLLFSV